MSERNQGPRKRMTRNLPWLVVLLTGLDNCGMYQPRDLDEEAGADDGGQQRWVGWHRWH